MREHTGSAFGAFGTFLRPAGFAQGPQRGRVPRHTLAPRVRVKNKKEERSFSPPPRPRNVGLAFVWLQGLCLQATLTNSTTRDASTGLARWCVCCLGFAVPRGGALSFLQEVGILKRCIRKATCIAKAIEDGGVEARVCFFTFALFLCVAVPRRARQGRALEWAPRLLHSSVRRQSVLLWTSARG